MDSKMDTSNAAVASPATPSPSPCGDDSDGVAAHGAAAPRTVERSPSPPHIAPAAAAVDGRGADGAAVELRAEVVAVIRRQKLWLHKPPYHPDHPASAAKLQALAHEMAPSIGLPSATPAAVYAALVDIQGTAVAKQAERRAAAAAATAVSVKGKLHVVGPHGGADPAPTELRASFDLATPGHEARATLEALAMASENAPTDGSVLKLQVIAAGRMLRDDATLGAQGWQTDLGARKGRSLRVTLLARVGPPPAAAEVPPSNPVVTIRNAAARLAREGYADFDLSDAKTGRCVAVPDGARASLITAIALHTKGRGLLSQPCDDAKVAAAAALPYLTEADAAFADCRDAGGGPLVDQIDNFGHLQLDVVWAYALLGDSENLPDAHLRLAAAERTLISKFERNFLTLAEVAAEQGKTLPPEVVQVARFWLLRGVAGHLVGDASAAKKDLDRAAIFLKGLQVDGAAVASLVEMGATQPEAIAALRQTGGFVEKAATHLLDAKAEAKRTRRRREAQLELGTTGDGSFVDLDALKTLTGMGFAKERAVDALKKSNNDTEQALLSLTAVPPPCASKNVVVDEVSVAMMVSMGFDAHAASVALHAVGGTDVDAAIKASLDTVADRSDPAEAGLASGCKDGHANVDGNGAADVAAEAAEAAAEATAEGDAAAAAAAAEEEAEAERRRADEEAYDEAREIIEEQLGHALRRTDLAHEVGGASLDDELLLLAQYTGNVAG